MVDALCDYQSKMFKLKTERDQLRSLLKNEKDKISQIEFQAKESNQSSALLENEIDRFKNDNAQLVRQVQALRERMTEQTALLKVECSATMDIKKEVTFFFS